MVKGGAENVKTYRIWSADTYSSEVDMSLTKTLRYFAPGDETGVLSAPLLIAPYKTTETAENPADGREPQEKAEKLPSDEAMFVYGQTSLRDDNNCHYIKRRNNICIRGRY